MKGNNMSLLISGLENSQSMLIYLCIEDKIKEITVTRETMDNLLALYKEKINFYDGELIPYDNHYGYKKERNELYEYSDISKLTKLNEYLSQIPASQQFRLGEDKLENLNFYIIKIPIDAEKSIIIFKKYQTIKRFYGTKPLLFEGTSFKEQDNKKFLLFETNNIDFFVYSDKVYINSAFFFQSITNENATDFSKAREVIRSINDIIPIENIDALISDMENNNSIKRSLLNIANNLDIISNINIDGIKNIINDLGLNVEISPDNKIVYDTKYKTEILDIFQDNYLTSQMTNSDYRTNSKIKVTKSSGKQ
ncbi:MAG: DUF4868 domain-containing protein [Alphaproteobacteria bacterium]|nr:DUF4868 domain-containing protein [Alphaproteobacteria bacterium]